MRTHFDVTPYIPIIISPISRRPIFSIFQQNPLKYSFRVECELKFLSWQSGLRRRTGTTTKLSGATRLQYRTHQKYNKSDQKNTNFWNINPPIWGMSAREYNAFQLCAYINVGSFCRIFFLVFEILRIFHKTYWISIITKSFYIRFDITINFKSPLQNRWKSWNFIHIQLKFPFFSHRRSFNDGTNAMKLDWVHLLIGCFRTMVANYPVPVCTDKWFNYTSLHDWREIPWWLCYPVETMGSFNFQENCVRFDCGRFFWVVFWNEYYKILKKFYHRLLNFYIWTKSILKIDIDIYF